MYCNHHWTFYAIAFACTFLLNAICTTSFSPNLFINTSVKKTKNVCGTSLSSFSLLFSSSNPSASEEFIVTKKDKDDVFEQLGYIPTNLVSIAARRGGNIDTPIVLKTYPLNGGASRRKAKAEGVLTPFPTLYWFCCKDTSKAIADLERRGYVGKLEERLRNEEGMFELFMESHACYGKERWNSLSDEHQKHILDNERMLRILRDSGVAGTEYKVFEESNIPSIKCLHAHYGHYRAQIAKEKSLPSDDSLSLDGISSNHDLEGKSGRTINIVGQWVDELLQSEYPDLIL